MPFWKLVFFLNMTFLSSNWSTVNLWGQCASYTIRLYTYCIDTHMFTDDSTDSSDTGFKWRNHNFSRQNWNRNHGPKPMYLCLKFLQVIAFFVHVLMEHMSGMIWDVERNYTDFPQKDGAILLIWARKKGPLVGWVIYGIILPSYIGIIIGHYKDPY